MSNQRLRLVSGAQGSGCGGRCAVVCASADTQALGRRTRRQRRPLWPGWPGGHAAPGLLATASLRATSSETRRGGGTARRKRGCASMRTGRRALSLLSAAAASHGSSSSATQDIGRRRQWLGEVIPADNIHTSTCPIGRYNVISAGSTAAKVYGAAYLSLVVRVCTLQRMFAEPSARAAAQTRPRVGGASRARRWACRSSAGAACDRRVAAPLARAGGRPACSSPRRWCSANVACPAARRSRQQATGQERPLCRRCAQCPMTSARWPALNAHNGRFAVDAHSKAPACP